MQPVNEQRPDHFKSLLGTLFFGALIGLITGLFLKGLMWIEHWHRHNNAGQPYHLLLIPIVLLWVEWTRRHTLFFPLKVSELRSADRPQQWSRFMTPLHFIGTTLSHLSGVSVGREGAGVLYSAGLIRVFNLNWIFWGPILGSIGFAAILGHYWVAPVFMMELFRRTTWLQKILGLIGAAVAVLLLQSLGIPHLFGHVHIPDFVAGFWDKFWTICLLGISAGFIMRLYKDLHFKLDGFFKAQTFLWRLALSVLLAGMLFVPELRKFQSLGIQQFTDPAVMQAVWMDAPVKLSLTLLSLAAGFWGGEFIPLVFAGTHWGYMLFSSMGHSAPLGALAGAYLFFAAATRLRWTGYALLLLTVGGSWWFWGWLLVTMTLAFSGSRSLYRP